MLMQKGQKAVQTQELHTAVLELSFASQKIAKDALSALSCEGEEKERSSLSFRLSSTKIIINTKAKDLVALRASLNSVLRLAQAIKEVDKAKQQ